jgi:membrane protein YdbS with pleckstrin-like domain
LNPTTNEPRDVSGEPAAPALPTATPAPAVPAPAVPVAAVPPGWQALPPAAAKVAAIVSALFVLPAFLPLLIVLKVALDFGVAPALAYAAALTLALAAAAAVYARKRVGRTRWRLDGRGLQVSRGLVWQGEVLVPRSRVQHLDIERGPIERRFGLATLVVHTAGTRLSALRQGGFVDADAVALRDALLPEAGDADDL